MPLQDMVKISTMPLHATDYKVALYLVGHIGHENIIGMPQKHIAEALGITQQAVSKSIRKLVELGVLYEMPNDHLRYKQYAVNLQLFVRGKSNSLWSDHNLNIHTRFPAT